jgi:hypothetical protein
MAGGTVMSRFSGEVWFLASCIEFYKTEKKMSGQEAFNYLHRTGATSFIIGCWDGLHMTSPSYIIDSIDEYITDHIVREVLPCLTKIS